ncbi:MAG: hypothetical protein F8N38_05615 [Hungatella sp.]|nr:hypothetical protein [Hungatella sp.]
MAIKQKGEQQYNNVGSEFSFCNRILMLKTSSKFLWTILVIMLFLTCYNLYFNSNYFLNIILPVLTCIAAVAIIKAYEKHYIFWSLVLNLFFMTITLLRILSNAAIPIYYTQTIINDLLVMLSIHSKCFAMAVIGGKIYITVKKRRFDL